MSRYRLSKISGIPWATLADIYSGKTHLNRCGAGTLSKLSKAFGLSIEGLLEIEETQTLFPVQKEFYMVMISERKANILDYSMEQLMNLNGQEPELNENLGQQFTM